MFFFRWVKLPTFAGGPVLVPCGRSGAQDPTGKDMARRGAILRGYRAVAASGRKRGWVQYVSRDTCHNSNGPCIVVVVVVVVIVVVLAIEWRFCVEFVDCAPVGELGYLGRGAEFQKEVYD